ncbi:hypothetical protein KQ302_04035 [Synechococcus sp. CS-602]|uniref:hypothetical protein n=1 Tax=Synechococcaceae TaxID=1890426 RepID=UPI0008FF21F2|nr:MULTISPECIES: hypothetical protein [Synechococcaceae]MCT4365414.1 hypothetical protein [Candidatus Regnicoccus frigidus MAG-AL1]APD47546.1 hypothetical protein BM449_03685 [Synechococcus sp. SynAce01]MCT0202479.1 hypothetical protein [Synechococcus sp. CS-603]MCT0204284.1 hypothetical protein [Synechococcus sp. CS-602]MCT0247126.1 hypothetical protein [Synechococcus sp. CS-601]
MPLWLTFVLLAAATLLWLLGSANADDVIALLEHILAVGLLLVVLLGGRLLLLELAGLALALWLPRARSGQAGRTEPHRDDVMIPF